MLDAGDPRLQSPIGLVGITEAVVPAGTQTVVVQGKCATGDNTGIDSEPGQANAVVLG